MASTIYATSRTNSIPITTTLPPKICGNRISTAAIETTEVSQITAPQGAASHRPTAATRSITAKNAVAT